ncbi:MAG: 6-carboxytetrahydropterin synthase QueD [Ruminococcus sp.]|nr:6-carboxytetrahydropterin synthase QueD [Ruminococcus sp.]
MYYLETEAFFDSAHFLAGYNGKCANIHGHRWKLSVRVQSEALIAEGEKRGMIIDFSDLKQAVRTLADSYDHALIIEQSSLRAETLNALNAEGFRVIEVAFRPTAENFAKHFYQLLSETGLPVRSVTVYETPQNCACYEEEPCSR